MLEVVARARENDGPNAYSAGLTAVYFRRDSSLQTDSIERLLSTEAFQLLFLYFPRGQNPPALGEDFAARQNVIVRGRNAYMIEAFTGMGDQGYESNVDLRRIWYDQMLSDGGTMRVRFYVNSRLYERNETFDIINRLEEIP